MRGYVVAVVLLCGLAAWPSGAHPQATDGECSSCAIAEQALHDLESIKVGMRRADVERFFIRAGGMTFRDRTDYVYQKCEYLKIQVSFTADPAVQRGLSSADTITDVSQLAVAHPSRD
jgi:hypothetical protein